VNVRPIGHTIDTAEPFDDRWAWVTMAGKTGEVRLHAGNASNYAEN
jgi:hypothetical protein